MIDPNDFDFDDDDFEDDPLDTPVPPEDGDRDTEDPEQNPAELEINWQNRINQSAWIRSHREARGAYDNESRQLNEFMTARNDAEISARRNFDKRYPGGE